MTGIRILVVLLVALLCGLRGFSAEVGLAAARDFARAWRGRAVSGGRTVRDEAGTNRFHVVTFEGGGWAAVGADDEDAPVIAFSDSDADLVEDEKNAIWFLVQRDAARRVKVRREGKAKGGVKRRHAGWSRVRPTGVKLAGSSTVKTAKSALDEVCVAPLIQSTWDQGSNIYNLYTPNNYVCGCVATMMAQMMRYFEWPKAAVEPKTYACQWGANINNSLTMTTGDKTMKGGAYEWSKMLLKPTSSSPLENRQEISKLCYDCGVSVGMMWSGAGSGAYVTDVADALVDAWGYSNAHFVMYDYPTASNPNPHHPYDFNELKTIVISNCEAGLPVGYGIFGDSAGGHAVVIDGYGYAGGEFYMHINPGWSGTANAWYSPPNLAMGGYAFDQSDELVYNIFPEGSGALVTGRVVDREGNPVSGATVTARAVYEEEISVPIYGSWMRTEYVWRTNELASVTTDAKGKYHLKTGVTGWATTLYAQAQKDRSLGAASAELPASQTMSIGYSFGNKIDFNIQLEDPAAVPKVLFR